MEAYSEDKFLEYIKNLKYDRFDIVDFIKNDEIFDAHKNISNYILKIVNDVSELFCNWVIRGIYYEYRSIDISNDDLDCDDDDYFYNSGELQQIKVDKYYRLLKFKNIQEWLQECYTGKSDSSFMSSGMGKIYLKFDSHYVLGEIIGTVIVDYLKNECGAKVDEDDWYYEFDELESDLRSDISKILSGKIFPKLSPIQCWNDYSESVIEEIAEENEAEKEYRNRMNEYEKASKKIFEEFFPELKKFGKITVDKSKIFMDKLNGLKKHFNEEDLKALKLFPPKNGFSNKALDNYLSILS